MWTSILALFTKPRTWIIIGLTLAIAWAFYIYNDREDKTQELTQVKTEVVQTREVLKQTQKRQVEINKALDDAQVQNDELTKKSETIQNEIKEVPNDPNPISKPVDTALRGLCKLDTPPCR